MITSFFKEFGQLVHLLRKRTEDMGSVRGRGKTQGP